MKPSKAYFRKLRKAAQDLVEATEEVRLMDPETFHEMNVDGLHDRVIADVREIIALCDEELA